MDGRTGLFLWVSDCLSFGLDPDNPLAGMLPLAGAFGGQLPVSQAGAVGGRARPEISSPKLMGGCPSGKCIFIEEV